MVCNKTLTFGCGNGRCVNYSLTCNGIDNCGDGTDESFTYAQCKEPYRLSALEVAAIVIGCIIGTVVLCCFIGSVIDCFMHVYKYWCSCVHKAYKSKCRRETIALRNQETDSNIDPTVLLVRAVPPSFSTIIVSCESREQGESSASHRLLGRVTNSDSIDNNNTIVNQHAIEMEGESSSKLRDMSTQTSPRLACIQALSTDERTGLLQGVRVHCLRESVEFTSIPGMFSKSPSPDGPMPPSYSSIFRNEYAIAETEASAPTMAEFLSPPLR